MSMSIARTDLTSPMNRINAVFELVAKCDRAGVVVTRVGLVIVLVWIGSLKAFRYEDEGIVPFVANSPFMSFFIGSRSVNIDST